MYTIASQWPLSLTLWIKFCTLTISSYKIVILPFPSTHRSPIVLSGHFSIFHCLLRILPTSSPLLFILIKGHYFIWELASLLHSGRLMWQPAAQHVSVILFSDSWGPLILFLCIFVNIRFHYSKSRCWKCFSSARRHSSHLTNMLFLSLGSFMSSTIRWEVASYNFQTKLCTRIRWRE